MNLCVPVLSYDDTSISIVWNKPDNYTDIVDYNVYMNNKSVGSASANNAINSVAYPYIKQFYAEDTAGFHNKITYHSFKATGLSPNTVYTFYVTAVHSSGKESAASVSVVQQTAPTFTNIFNIVTLGAVGDGSTLNTKVIQKAIDGCSTSKSTSAYGCKVLIPFQTLNTSTYVTGSLFFNSFMTFEIEKGATLLASSKSIDFPPNGNRPYSLLNTKGSKSYSDIRITGKGTIDGNGWTKSSADITDEAGNKLPYYAHGSTSTWQTLGVLAKDQIQAAVNALGGKATSTQISNFYSNARSSLVSFSSVTNIFFTNLKLLNPSFHGVQFSECINLVFTNTLSLTYDVNNGDGVELGSTNNALIYNNLMNNGDDCINFSAGQGKADENKTANLNQFTWIFNNYLRRGHGGVVVGSNTAGFIQDILAEDNLMFMTDNGFRLKSTPATGGGAKRIVFRDTAMREVGTTNTVKSGGQTFGNHNRGNPIIVTLAYSAVIKGQDQAVKCAQFSYITFKQISVDNGIPQTSDAVISVDGYGGKDSSLPYPETFQENLVFDTIKLKNVSPATIATQLGELVILRI
uniref:Fibronectin type-III domain-containing protein n=1 Tax=Ditylenchus dipsaci TaxID=166011 RepID=A0A915DP69_9BILA